MVPTAFIQKYGAALLRCIKAFVAVHKLQQHVASPTLRPNPGTTDVRGRSQDQERWSEHRIDAATSVAELEKIRHRLLTLVDRVEARLKEKRLMEALDESDVIGAAEYMKQCTMEELLTKLSKNKTASDKNDEREEGSGRGKRQISEVATNSEMSDPNKNKHPRTLGICTLCLTQIDSPLTSSSSVGTCEICNERHLCDQCRARCTCCGRMTCSDCLMNCDGCGSVYHCSDCIKSGGGQCMACRPKKARARRPAREQMTIRLPRQAPSLPNSRTPKAAAPSQLYSFPRQHHGLASSNPVHQSQLFSIHRFLIREAGVLGLNIAFQPQTKSCLISKVHPQSVAETHGVHANDVILHPTSIADNDPGTYNLFLAAVKHRPIRFEVLRPVTAASTKVVAGTLHALHRFVISRPGAIGMSLEKKGEATRVSSVLPGSLSEAHGILPGDVVCVPFTNGVETENKFSWICNYYANHPRRPLAVEVWRPLSTTAETRARCQPRRCGTNENPFVFAFPRTIPQQEALVAMEVQDKLARHGTKTATGNPGNESSPVISLVDDSDDDLED